MHVPGIPEGGPAELRHFTAADLQMVIVPERISQVEETVTHCDIPALLQGTLPVRRPVEPAGNHLHIPGSVQGSLFVKGLVLKNTHFLKYPFITITSSTPGGAASPFESFSQSIIIEPPDIGKRNVPAPISGNQGGQPIRGTVLMINDH